MKEIPGEITPNEALKFVEKNDWEGLAEKYEGAKWTKEQLRKFVESVKVLNEEYEEPTVEVGKKDLQILCRLTSSLLSEVEETENAKRALEFVDLFI